MYEGDISSSFSADQAQKPQRKFEKYLYRTTLHCSPLIRYSHTPCILPDILRDRLIRRTPYQLEYLPQSLENGASQPTMLYSTPTSACELESSCGCIGSLTFCDVFSSFSSELQVNVHVVIAFQIPPVSHHLTPACVLSRESLRYPPQLHKSLQDNEPPHCTTLISPHPTSHPCQNHPYSLSPSQILIRLPRIRIHNR